MSNKLLLRPLNLFTQLNKFSASAEKKKNYSKVSRLKPELEEGFNNQINTEFFASFTYLAMVIDQPAVYLRRFRNKCKRK